MLLKTEGYGSLIVHKESNFVFSLILTNMLVHQYKNILEIHISVVKVNDISQNYHFQW